MAKGTDKAIAASLRKLLNEKPLNKITISDIANDCGINRMTFYYHFKDIYNLVEWMFEERAREELGTTLSYGTWQEALAKSFEGLAENKVFIINVYNSIGSDKLSRYLNSVMFPVLMNYFNSIPGSETVSESDKEFIVNVYTVGLVAFILQWVANDMQDDWVPMVERLNVIGYGTFEDTIHRIQSKKFNSEINS